MDDIIIGGVPLNEKNYLSFRKAYKKALSEGKDEFTWNKHPFIVSFAKYVLECMETYPTIKPLIEGDD